MSLSPLAYGQWNNYHHWHWEKYSAFILALEVNLQAHYYTSNQYHTAANPSYDIAWTGVKREEL